jgi:hypothetical protein
MELLSSELYRKLNFAVVTVMEFMLSEITSELSFWNKESRRITFVLYTPLLIAFLFYIELQIKQEDYMFCI